MKLVWIAIGIIVILILAVCVISWIENRKLTITSYPVASAKIPESFDGCRIVVLADLHNAVFGERNERLLQAIRQQKPDYIILAGDMLVGKQGASTAVPAELLQELSKLAPVYYGMGNHEMRIARKPEEYGSMWEDYKNRLGTSVIWLVDKSVMLTRGKEQIALYGLDLDPIYYKRFKKHPMKETYLKQKLGASDANRYDILIAHNPNYFPEYAAWGADLVLSGHIHGGMIRLPGLGGCLSPMFHIFPKYDRGWYQEGNSVMLLSGGLGNHTFKFRVHNLPELLVVTLQTQNTDEDAR